MAKEPQTENVQISVRIRRSSLEKAKSAARDYSEGNLSRILRAALRIGLRELQDDPRLLFTPPE